MNTRFIFTTVALMIVFCKMINAQITFQKTFGGTNNDYGTSVIQTSDGGYIIAGYTNNFGAGAFEDIYLIRTKANGDTLWTKTYGGAGQERAYAVRQNGDGGYIITGFTNSFGAGNDDVYLIRTDANGNTLWAKTYGGSGLDIGYAVRQTTDGGFIVAGSTDIGNGNGDLYLLKIGSSGDTIFTKIIGGTGIDRASSVEQTTDGGFIVGGYTNSFGAGGNDFYLLKTNSNGMITWAKTYGGAAADNLEDVRQTIDGGYILAGNTMSFGIGAYDVYLIKTDGNGTPSWSKTFGGVNSEYGYSVRQTNDGGYIVAGYSASFNGIYLIHADGNGNAVWTKTFGGTVFDWGNSISQTSDGGFIIGGYTLSFGAGNMDVYFLKTDANGNSGCSEGIPATITGTAATQLGSAASVVSAGGQVNTPATASHSGGTVTTLCIATGMNEKNQGVHIIVSPNPFVSELSIGGTKENGKVMLSCITGKEIMRINANAGDTKINTEKLMPGMYLLTYSEGGTNISFKVVKY